MQTRVESKTKLPQYHSLKQYETIKDPTKKSQKPAHQKSNHKNKMTKTNPHSKSKSKICNKNNKINQNFNSINVPPDKQKNQHHEMQPLKRQPRKQQKLTRNSSQKLIKSKSAIRLQPKTERSRLSPSPILQKDPHLHQQKTKVSRSQTSRSEKEKKPSGKMKQEKAIMKRADSMATINIKRQITERNPINRVSIKTQGSSKMNSVIRQDQKQKKTKKKKFVGAKKDTPVQKEIIMNKKLPKTKLQTKIQRSILYSQVSFQEYCQQNPYESALINTQNGMPYSFPKVKTQGCQVSSMEQAFDQKQTIQKHNAAIKIQKTFRGYITRKYIFEAIYLSTKAKIIQTWWRKMMQKKKLKPHKPHLSIQSSLITIKDFNDTIKTEKQKLFSESKENTLSNQKINFRDLFKNILEQDQESDRSISQQKAKPGQLREKCLSPEQKILNKQVYIQQKINAQINSEKVFNSPKPLSSPGLKTPTHITCNIKQFFNSSNEKQKIKELIQSPRMRSPPPPKTTPISNNQYAPTQEFQIYKPVVQTYKTIQTNFQAIQEISLLLVDYFRDREKQMHKFLTRIQAMAYFRTQIILNNWNSFKLLTESYFQDDNTLPLDYQFLQHNERPAIFPQELREDILKFPEIEIDLNNKNYNLEDKLNGPIHRAYIQFIFDVLEQAFYQNYKNCIIEWKKSLRVRHFDTQQHLFQFAFSDALGFLTEWAEVLCGVIVDHPEDYLIQREERMRKLERQIDHWDLGQGSKLGIKIQISQKVLDLLIQELEIQLIHKGL